MPPMKRTSFILNAGLALALLASVPVNSFAADAPAAKPATVRPTGPLPSVDVILAKYVQALGGEAAIKKLNTRIIQGSLEVPGMGTSASWELNAKAPNKRLTIMEVQGFGKVLEGYNGKVGWSQNAQTGAALKTGDELVRLKRDADFYRDLKFKEFFPQMNCTGIEKIGETEAYVIEAKPTEGRPEKFYFDRRTGLQIRNESEMESQGAMAKIAVSFEDYRTVDGVKFPFTVSMDITMGNGQAAKAALKCREYKHNVPIDDAKFDQPVPK
jgi:zinc protease